jgi:hypothetical protein
VALQHPFGCDKGPGEKQDNHVRNRERSRDGSVEHFFGDRGGLLFEPGLNLDHHSLQQHLQALRLVDGHHRVLDRDPAGFAELAQRAGDGFARGAGH